MTNVLVRKEGGNINQTARKLRSRNGKKGFYATVPLKVDKVNMASVASFLLSEIIEKEFNEADTKHG